MVKSYKPCKKDKNLIHKLIDVEKNLLNLQKELQDVVNLQKNF